MANESFRDEFAIECPSRRIDMLSIVLPLLTAGATIAALVAHRHRRVAPSP